MEITPSQWSVYNNNNVTRCFVGGLYTGAQNASSFTITSNQVNDIALHWEIWESQTHIP